MLRIAKKESPEVNFIKMDMRLLKFSDENFDGLISPYSLIHIPDLEVVTTLKEWNRVLKNDGYLSILVQEGESDHWVSQPFAPEKQIFFNFFSIERLQKYLEDSGFSTVSVEKVPCEDALTLSKSLLYFLAKKY
jgi:ubiquinone/menaquinone biosynthesis C-methylase UbiE